MGGCWTPLTSTAAPARSLARLGIASRPPPWARLLMSIFTRSHGARRRTNRRNPRLRGVQAAQLPDREVQAERSRPDRVPQVLPLVRLSPAAQGNSLSE